LSKVRQVAHREGAFVSADEAIIAEQRHPHRKWYQFTLTAILLLMLWVAVVVTLFKWAQPETAPRTVVAVDLEQLHSGLFEARKKFGHYPPADFSNTGELRVFIGRAFPRYNGNPNFPQLSPAEALVFWLGGYWDGKQMCGFSADPRDPFVTPRQSPTMPRSSPLVPFDEKRLFDADGNGFPEYYPPGRRPSDAAPYVYFAEYPSAGTSTASYRHPTARGVAVPYLADDGTWIDSFQIVSAGADNDYGSALDRRLPSGAGLVEADDDNQTSFATSGVDRYREGPRTNP
jgi:hypothetical protein